jgi:hypothetical protein
MSTYAPAYLQTRIGVRKGIGIEVLFVLVGMSFFLGLQRASARTRTSRYLFRQSRRYHPIMPSEQQSSTPLYFNDGPLVWIDCEMTGLDPSKDKIMEIAVRFSSEHSDMC